MSGRLFLVPTPLGDAQDLGPLSPALVARVRGLDYFIAENPKVARAFLKLIEMPRPIAELRIESIEQVKNVAAADALLSPIAAGHDAALMSDAGAPAVADPGARLIGRAHELGIPVVPLVGPSSILLALMASGMNGQAFAFHGYLPVDESELAKTLLKLEQESRREGRTQIFIETPYRNDRLLRILTQTCASETMLCVATQLTQPDESIATKKIAEWKAAPPQIGKRPSVFLLLAAKN